MAAPHDDDPLGQDIQKRLQKAQYKEPKKKKKKRSINWQLWLSFLIVLATIMGILLPLMAIIK